MKRQNDNEKTYNYCECCGKPVESVNYDGYSFCKECAIRLLKEIYGEEYKDQDTVFGHCPC